MAANDELYIDGELIELGPDSVIAVTKQVQDVASLQTRNGDITNQFKVPRAGKNNASLGFPGMIQSTSLKPYKKNDAKYVVNGVELIYKGVAIIESTDKFFNIQVTSGNGSFFELIDGLDMRNIDLSDLNHAWNITNIKNSRTNTTGYKYPLIDYGQMASSGNQVNVKQLFPAIFTRTLIERIVTAQGWTLAGDVLNDVRYQKHMLLWSKDKWERDQSIYSDQTTELASPQQSESYVHNGGSQFATLTLYDLELEDSTYITGNSYTVPDNMIADINVDALITFTTGAPPPNFATPTYYGQIRVVDLTTGTILGTCPGYVVGTNALGAISWNQTNLQRQFRGTVSGVQLTSGHQIGLKFSVLAYYDVDFTVDSIDYKIDMSPEIAYGQTFPLSEQLPDMSQKDFFKAIMNTFGLIPDPNPLTKVLTLRFYRSITDNIPNADDWSSKIDDADEPQIAYRLGNYAQTNWCKYQHDEGVTEYLGDGSFNVNDETLDVDNTAIELPFGASDMVKRLFTLGVDIDMPYIDKIDSTTNKPKNRTSLRVATDRTSTTGFTLVYSDGSTTQTVTTDIPMCHFKLTGETTNLDWDSLIEDYYPTLTASLYKTKVVRIKVNLSPLEVYRFDHFIPVYISKFNSYFYVNKIENFKSGKLTTVELIRI